MNESVGILIQANTRQATDACQKIVFCKSSAKKKWEISSSFDS